MKDSSGNEIELTDALAWKGTKDDVLTLKTECEAKIGDAYYATLADAFAAANKTGDTVIELLDDINMTGKNWTPVGVDGYHGPVSYTHLRAHETGRNLVCRLLLEKKKKKKHYNIVT